MKGKSVAVLGAGASGLSMVRALVALQAQVTLYSDGPPGQWGHSVLPERQLRDARTASLAGEELLCKSPGVPNRHPLVVQAKERGTAIWTDANMAYHFRKAPIIAITGSNGKTTTALMVEQLLSLAGLRVFCGGNIGRPCSEIICDTRDYDIYVWELSSFQLEYCPQFRAEYSTILNLSPNHGERYQHFSQYRRAKYNLLQKS